LTVLAGLLQQDPERNAGILRTLSAEAFTIRRYLSGDLVHVAR
jgi:hypothetical protein